MITLHSQLREDCLVLGRFPLCHLLLMRDANYPWFILVPDREDICEIYQLSEGDQYQLTRESSLLARVLAEQFKADKINIAALGNVVPQLHIHHVVRFHHDVAWPAPVWGVASPLAYLPAELEGVVDRLKAGLAGEVEFVV